MKNKNNSTSIPDHTATNPGRSGALVRNTSIIALAVILSSAPESRTQEPRGTPITPLTNAPPVSANAKPARPASFPHPDPNAPIKPSDLLLRHAKSSGPPEVTFDTLGGFLFAETEDVMDGKKDPLTASRKTREQIPTSIKAFNEKELALKGFMVPLKLDDNGMVSEFLLLRSQATCCYGVPPKINEWVMVKMSGKGVRSVMDEVVTVRGILHVGGIRENGYLTGIYSLDADKLLTTDGK